MIVTMPDFDTDNLRLSPHCPLCGVEGRVLLALIWNKTGWHATEVCGSCQRILPLPDVDMLPPFEEGDE